MAAESSSNDASDADWQSLAPALDQALDDLPDNDRAPLLMRYIENRSAREISTSLNLSEAAAQKRIQRALEKLRTRLRQRGVAMPASALAVLLGNVVSSPSVRAAEWAAGAMSAPPTKLILGKSTLSNVFARVLPALGGTAAGLMLSLPLLWPAAIQWKQARAQAVQQTEKALPSLEQSADSANSHQRELDIEDISNYSPEQILAALRGAIKGPEHSIQALKLSAIISHIPPKHLPAVNQLVMQRCDLAEQRSLFRPLLTAWGNLTPEDALAFTIDFEISNLFSNRNSAIEVSLFYSWLSTNPTAATEWLANHIDDARLATPRVSDSYFGEVRISLLKMAAQNLLTKDAASAVKFCDSLAAGSLRDSLQPVLGADSNPVDYRQNWDAERWMQLGDALLDAKFTNHSVLSLFVRNWAKRNESDARAWVQTLRDNEARVLAQTALLGLNEHWRQTGEHSFAHDLLQDHSARADEFLRITTEAISQQDALTRIASTWPDSYQPSSLADWLAVNSTGAEADEAFAILARRVSHTWSTKTDTPYMVQALAWTEKIQSEQLRSLVACGLYRRWCHENPSAAQEYVTSDQPGIEHLKTLPKNIR